MAFRSLMSNPIDAGVDAFSKVSAALNAIEDAPIKRKLMEEEVADRKAQRELRITEERRAQAQENRLTKQNEWIEESRMNEKELRSTMSAKYKMENGLDMNDEEGNAVLKAAANAPLFKGSKTIQDVKNKIRDVDGFSAALEKMQPAIKTKLETAKNNNMPVARITRDEMPDAANLFDRIYGDQISEGLDRTGKKPEYKRLHSIFIDDKGNLSFELEVKDSEGNIYYPPVTPGRSGDPNEPVLSMPMNLLGSHAGAQNMLGKMLTSRMIQVGDKEAWKKIEEEQLNAKEGKAIGRAMEAIKALGPKAGVSQKRETFLSEAVKAGLSSKRASEIAKDIVQEKEARQLGKYDLAFAAAEGDPAKALKLAEEKDKSPTVAALALQASGGDPVRALNLVAQTNRESKKEKGGDGEVKLTPSQKIKLGDVGKWTTQKMRDAASRAKEDEFFDKEEYNTMIEETRDRAREIIQEKNVSSTQAIKMAQEELGTSDKAIKRKESLDLGATKMKRMLTGADKTRVQSKAEVVKTYRKAGWSDADILKAGASAGADLSEEIGGNKATSGRQLSVSPDSVNPNARKVNKDSGMTPVLDYKQGQEYLRKAGWKSGKPTAEQINKARSLAKKDGYQVSE